MRYTIEKMGAEHLGDVLELERLCFPKPWTRHMLEGELANEAAHYSVCISDGRPVGYVGYWYTADGGDITNVAVHPSYRRAGLASALVEHMLAEAGVLGAHRMALEVRASNAAAIALYEKYGFTAAGVRRRYYSDNGEDAIIMIKEW